ncbi:MAG: heavy metal-binding domain-containing protein [Planctomycetes bacterium]|nr:heavy metal-binding domain-containing protein [Planctomycetota bacterium]
MEREGLLVGTRPEIDGGKIIMTGTEGFDSYEIMEYKGMVWGISVRAKDMGQDCAMGCKQMTGGELTSYAAIGDESRQRSIDLMLQMAGRQGANAIINVEFELAGASQGAAQVVVHGTAVIIKPVINYVPTGAMGNILAEMQELPAALHRPSCGNRFISDNRDAVVVSGCLRGADTDGGYSSSFGANVVQEVASPHA